MLTKSNVTFPSTDEWKTMFMPALSANILKTCLTSESRKLNVILSFLLVNLTSPLNVVEVTFGVDAYVDTARPEGAVNANNNAADKSLCI